LEIKNLKPGQKVVIKGKKEAWAVKIEQVYENQNISVRSLIDNGCFVINHPEDIKGIEPMEGKSILPPIQCVECPAKQKLVPIDDCSKCGRCSGKEFTNHIICRGIKRN